jgi:hypothetical protein
MDKKLLSKLSPEELADLSKMLEEYETAKSLEAAHDGFLPFVKHLWPKFIEGEHHRIMAEKFEAIERGDKRFVIINVPPRHGKSELASKYFPAWFMGRNPDKKIIMSSHTAGLAVDFGRAVKNIVAMPQYRDVFEDVALKADSKAAGRWGTNHGGEYYAIGTGGAIAGRGAHLYVIDDPHSEQDAINAAHNPDVWNKVWDWYTGGPVQRLQPGGAICLVMCVRKGEMVLCANGTWAAIEKLALGQEVITYKDGASTVGKITNKTSSGTTKIFRVKSTSCQLDVSDRHPFLVIEKTGKKKSEWAVKWVRAKELKPGDHVVTIKDVNYGSDTSRSHTKSSFKSKSPLSKQEVWLLGYLWGDGWIMSNRGRKTGIRVACSDKPCLDKIVLDALNEWSGRLPECASRVRTGAKIKASKSALANSDGKRTLRTAMKTMSGTRTSRDDLTRI